MKPQPMLPLGFSSHPSVGAERWVVERNERFAVALDDGLQPLLTHLQWFDRQRPRGRQCIVAGSTVVRHRGGWIVGHAHGALAVTRPDITASPMVTTTAAATPTMTNRRLVLRWSSVS